MTEGGNSKSWANSASDNGYDVSMFSKRSIPHVTFFHGVV